MHRLRPITDHVWVAQSALYATNSGVVTGSGDGAVLVDPGVYPGELAALADDIGHAGRRVVAGFATHAHWDHVLWPEAVGFDVPRYATVGTAAAAIARRAELVDAPLAAIAATWPAAWPAPRLAELLGVPGGEALHFAGGTLHVIDVPGHAVGHGAVLVEEDRVLFAGDMVSDVEIPLPDWDAADPLGEYHRGLDVLASVVGDADIVVPGHGSIGSDLRARLDADRRYLDVLAGAGGDAAAAAAADDERLHRHPFNRDHHLANMAGVRRARDGGNSAACGHILQEPGRS